MAKTIKTVANSIIGHDIIGDIEVEFYPENKEAWTRSYAIVGLDIKDWHQDDFPTTQFQKDLEEYLAPLFSSPVSIVTRHIEDKPKGIVVTLWEGMPELEFEVVK